MFPIQQLIAFKAALDGYHDGLFFALLAVLVGGIVYGVRRFFPAGFNALPPVVQHFPAVALGALVGALSSGMDPIAALAGAFAGLTAIGGHHALKSSPLPYGGKPTGDRSATLPPKTGVMLVLLALLIGGCTALKNAEQAVQTVAQYDAKACDLIGQQQQDAIDAQANRLKISTSAALQLFREQCIFARQLAGAQAVGAIGAIGVKVDADAGCE